MKYLITKDALDAPGLDVYLDPEEPATITQYRQTPVGLALARRVLELEERQATYDIDEVLATIREEYQ